MSGISQLGPPQSVLVTVALAFLGHLTAGSASEGTNKPVPVENPSA